MPVKSRAKSHSFNESYYHDNFTTKRKQLSHHLERRPDDLTAKNQVQFIDRVLREGDDSDKSFDWQSAWNYWQKHYSSICDFDEWNINRSVYSPNKQRTKSK